jgi:hypothetical protein
MEQQQFQVLQWCPPLATLLRDELVARADRGEWPGVQGALTQLAQLKAAQSEGELVALILDWAQRDPICMATVNGWCAEKARPVRGPRAHFRPQRRPIDSPLRCCCRC